MKDYGFTISDDRLHKTRFCKKEGGGANQNFPHKEGAKDWGIGAKRWGLERFRILKGLAKKRGVTFLRDGAYTLVPTMLPSVEEHEGVVMNEKLKVALNDKTE